MTSCMYDSEYESILAMDILSGIITIPIRASKWTARDGLAILSWVELCVLEENRTYTNILCRGNQGVSIKTIGSRIWDRKHKN
jgi:hypothetical protein